MLREFFVQILMDISLYSLVFLEHAYLQIYNNNHDLRSCNSSSLHSSREKSKETCKVKNAEILCYILNNKLKLLNEQQNQLFCCICCKF